MSVKAKPRKTEACEFCNGKHYSEQARLRCMKSKTPDCECPDYWAERWYSHAPDCPLRGEFRTELRVVADRKNRGKSAPTGNVRRKA